MISSGHDERPVVAAGDQVVQQVSFVTDYMLQIYSGDESRQVPAHPSIRTAQDKVQCLYKIKLKRFNVLSPDNQQRVL